MNIFFNSVRTGFVVFLLCSFLIHINVQADTAKTGMRNITPMQVVKDMGIGWNLGNTLDTEGPNEMYWGNPKTTKPMIDVVAQKGFTTMRLPVTWRYHQGGAPNYIIQEAWLDRVEEVANYAFANNMYVIINIHHDDPWIIPTYEKADEVKDRLYKTWTQIANRFKDYGDYLIFETLNEPRYEGSPEEWSGGTKEGRDVVNQYHKSCVDAIRATGGNNAKRKIMISPYAASTGQSALNDLIIPNYDKNTIVSIHSYFPYAFCLGGTDKTWGTNADKLALDNELDKIYNKFVANGIAVVMGEWCSSDQDNLPDRMKHTEYYANGCVKRNICPVYWETGGLMDRKNLTWFEPEIADLLVNANAGPVTSGNPIIKHIRSADPSAEVWEDGKVWVYASHDQDDATDYSTMDGYHVFSSYDMVNWTDHGEILHSKDVSWGVTQGGYMFAPDAAFKNGTYYLYFPHMAANWKWRVGVATSDKPEGPFTDIGRYIEGPDEIDPTCFMDDDGQAYLMWGGGSNPPKIAKLKENMTELAEVPRVIDYGTTNFGEGGYMHKRDGKYYFSYTCNTCYPYQGFYSMGDSPYGPFVYKGQVNKNPPGAQDHHSIIEYHGQPYYFYHVGNYGDQASLYRRNVCVDSLFYNADGTMKVVVQTKTGVGQNTIGMTDGNLVPGRIEAEIYFRQNGIDTLIVNDSTTVVTDINSNDWFDFVLEILGNEEYEAKIKVDNPVIGTQIYLLVDEVIKDTISIDSITELLQTSLFLHRGKHTLKFLFSNAETDTSLMHVDWIDLKGDTEYYAIQASAAIGGSIEPEGKTYVPQGDSARFNFDWDAGYKPDSILIDTIFKSPASFYTFYDVAENHSIKATFSECTGTVLAAYIKVNNEANLDTSEISVREGDVVTLSIEYEGSGVLSWISPKGEISVGKTYKIDGAQQSQSGAYTAVFVNSGGCKSNLNFIVTISPLELDVYQAEDWLAQNGVQAEGCADFGGGDNIGYIENNDWCTYNIDMEKAGFYKAIFRVATETNGGRIEISINGNVLGTVTVSGASSDGWQDWFTTDPIEIELEQGKQVLKLTYKGGGGYLFNLNWFDLTLDRATVLEEIKSSDKNLNCFPTPNGEGFNLIYQLNKTSDVQLEIVNISGITVQNLVEAKNQNAGMYRLVWNGTNNDGNAVPNGIYFIVFVADDSREVQKVILSK